MTDLAQSRASDVATLMKRALLNKTLTMFGVDGLGEYGINNIFQTHSVSALLVYTISNDGERTLCTLLLENYNAATHGHAATDKNLTLSLQQRFDAVSVSRDSWEYGSESEQEDAGITLVIHKEKMLGY